LIYNFKSVKQELGVTMIRYFDKLEWKFWGKDKTKGAKAPFNYSGSLS
tara:strand:- start:21933 stop:22076 length:144 start_codon:yes stop_codon:yes gene_type:complete